MKVSISAVAAPSQLADLPVAPGGRGGGRVSSASLHGGHRSSLSAHPLPSPESPRVDRASLGELFVCQFIFVKLLKLDDMTELSV